MITITLERIKSHNPCESGWQTLLASKGGEKADMTAYFPVTDIIESNGLDDALRMLRYLPEYSNIWRKYAVWCARQVQHLMTDRRSLNALDVAWRHSDGLATDAELKAARDAADAAWAAAWAAAAAAWAAAWAAAAAAWAAADAAAADAAWAAADAAAARTAARQKQQDQLIAILTAGTWVEVGNE